jgi:dTDP-4-dehydrorhamnose 3,5-epimerase
MSDHYQPKRYTGFWYDDPSIGVEWPVEPAVMSDRDGVFPPLNVSAL